MSTQLKNSQQIHKNQYYVNFKILWQLTDSEFLHSIYEESVATVIEDKVGK